jgi:hypothetical protein
MLVMVRIRKTESQPSAGWNRFQAQIIALKTIICAQLSPVKRASHGDHLAGCRNFEFPKTSPGSLCDGLANLTLLYQITVEVMPADHIP